LAEGLFRSAAAERGLEHRFLVDSAGTGGWHAGDPPDPRSIAVAARHGVDISAQRARKVIPADFARFDLLLGMDASTVDILMATAPAQARSHIGQFMEFAGLGRRDVPDPYYGGLDGFEAVYRMIREASETLLDRLADRDASAPSGQASSTM
jgi:protein-tyrosine phosphatase